MLKKYKPVLSCSRSLFIYANVVMNAVSNVLRIAYDSMFRIQTHAHTYVDCLVQVIIYFKLGLVLMNVKLPIQLQLYVYTDVCFCMGRSVFYCVYINDRMRRQSII